MSPRGPSATAEPRLLREVVDGDLDALYEQQADPESSAMAGVPSRDRAGFEAHMRRVRSNDANVFQVIDVEGQVAGSAVSWPSEDGRRYVGYWLGREYWGRGLATRALAELLEELPRPLHALVLTSNAASIRVLEKCGFVEVGPADDKHADEGVPGLLFELRDDPTAP